MKIRKREDFFDKEIGNRKFAKFILLAEKDNHTLTDFKEYYEVVKFKMDGYDVVFDKSVRNLQKHYDFIIKTLDMRKAIGVK